MSKSREQINKFLSEINITGKKVLDVGVQDNPAYKYCRGTAEKYLTLDVDNQWNPNFVYDLNDDKIDLSILNNILNADKIIGGFDIVFCLEVLEHCWNPIVALKNLYDFTSENGVCYISVPFINPIHDKWDFLRYTPEWFEKVLPMVGFKEFKIHLRKATVGIKDLMNFYQGEGLKMSKIREAMGDGGLKDLIGVIVEARK